LLTENIEKIQQVKWVLIYRVSSGTAGPRQAERRGRRASTSGERRAV
jgi:hypothetical protein